MPLSQEDSLDNSQQEIHIASQIQGSSQLVEPMYVRESKDSLVIKYVSGNDTYKETPEDNLVMGYVSGDEKLPWEDIGLDWECECEFKVLKFFALTYPL